jgi:hypothetical protein
MFGGNSNWRGPVWMPVNMLIGARCFSTPVHGNSFTIECPTGSGKQMNSRVAQEIGRWLSSIFLKDGRGERPARCVAQPRTIRTERLPLFYEYFHGDTGVGASHQTDGPGRCGS